MTKKFTIGLGIVRPPTVVSTVGVQVSDVPSKGVLGVSPVDLIKDVTVQIGTIQIDPNTVQQSEASREVFHSTLFESFQLSAASTYNFFTEDETKAVVFDTSSSLDQIPRYVTLTWRPSPLKGVFKNTTKGTRDDSTTRPPRPPIVPMDVIAVSAANGYIMPGTVSARVTEPIAGNDVTVLNEDAFLTEPTAAGQLAAQHVSLVDSPFTAVMSSRHEQVRVNFVDTSIAGALDPNRLDVANEDLHLVIAGSLAKVIGGFEVISEFNQDVPTKNPPPTFPAPIESPILSYIGYLIERHDLLPDGTMRLGRTIRIDNPETTSYVDREVHYGGVYAYKIRAVVQWVHLPSIGFSGPSSTERSAASDELIGTRVASYYFGDWSDWSRTTVSDDLPPDPPDEVYVRPVSPRGLIRIAWKMPNDPQRDIDSIHLLRATVVDGQVGEWVDVGTFIPANGSFDDLDVVPHETSRVEYIYTLYSTSRHGNLSVLGEQFLVRLLRPSSRREHPIKRTRPIGGDPMAHPSISEPLESTELLARRRVVMYCRSAESGHPLRDRDYMLDIRSLSTGERVQVDLNVDSTEILSKDA